MAVYQRASHEQQGRKLISQSTAVHNFSLMGGSIAIMRWRAGGLVRADLSSTSLTHAIFDDMLLEYTSL